MHGAKRCVVCRVARHLEYRTKQLVPKGRSGHAALELAIARLSHRWQRLPVTWNVFLSAELLQLPIIFCVFCADSPRCDLLFDRQGKSTRFPITFLGFAGVLASHHLHLLYLEHPLPHELVDLPSTQLLVPILDELELLDRVQALR